jgi:hypothetical protein
MAEAIVETRYLSAGANRYPGAADWGHDGIIAFAADTNIGIWDPAVRYSPHPFLSPLSKSAKQLRVYYAEEQGTKRRVVRVLDISQP